MLNLRPVWGIDIGDASLKAVKLKRVGNQIVLLDFQVIRYDELTGESGARREGVTGDALAALHAAGLGRDHCLVSIAPQAIFSRFISLPPVDKRRVPEIVLYEARQQIPFSLNEVIWAYQAVRKEFIPGEEIEIGLFAVKRDVVDAYIGELTPIAKQLHGIQVAPLALYNFFRHDVTFEKPTVVMDIGAQSTDLLIIDGDKFWLRNLPIAGNSFTAVLEKRLNIPREDAQKLKHAVSESRHRRKLLDVLRPVMRDLVGEVQRSIGYYKSLSHEVKFEEIVVVGEGYRLFGLDRFLAERLQYKISPIHQLNNLIFQGDPDRVKELGQTLPTLGVAIGLALQGLGQGSVSIDLLPDDFVVDRELHHKRFSGLIAAALVCGAVGCFYVQGSRAYGRIEGMMGRGADTLKQYDDINRAYRLAQGAADQNKLDLFDTLGQYRQYDSRVIDSISRVLPRGVRINGFAFSEGGESMGGMDDDMPEMRSSRRLGGSSRPMGGPMPGMGGAGPMRRGDPDMEDDAPAGLGGDEQKVLGSSRTLRFNAWSAAEKEAVALTEHLPAAIKRATIFPEGVELVTGVVVGPIAQAAGTGIEDGAAVEKTELTAEITVGLLDATEAADARIKKREELAKEKELAEAAREEGAEAEAEAVDADTPLN